jgi:pyruvate formate-lyase activating enzyme-like uncharacterized protein
MRTKYQSLFKSCSSCRNSTKRVVFREDLQKNMCNKCYQNAKMNNPSKNLVIEFPLTK